MALKPITIFCPNCCKDDDLWISPREYYKVECKSCGRKWERNELNEICTKLVNKAKTDRKFQWWSECLRIQMQHTINPFTGNTYA
jgi:hypothetical protein